MQKKIKAFYQKLFSNKLIKNYIWVLLGQNLGTIFSMVSLIITLRIISTYNYGSLVIIQTYAALISGIFGLRTFNGVIKFVTDAECEKDSIKMKQFINSAILWDFLSGFFALVCGFAILKPVTLLMQWDAEMLNCVFLYLPVVVFSPILHGAPIGVLRKLDRFKQVNIIHTILYGSHTLFLGILLLSDTKNFVLVLLSYAFAEIIESLILFGYAILVMQKTSSLRGFWKAGFARNPRFLKYNVLYGLTTSFDQLLGNVSTLLINRFIGNFATAYLKVITKICGMFTKLTNPLGQIFYPELCSWIAKKDFKKAYRVSFKFQFLICAGGLILTGIMFGTYDLWIQIFDASMVAAKWQSLLYMLFTVLSISMICITQLVFALDLVKGNLVLIIVFNILYVIALIPTIQAFGIYGYLLLQIAQLLLVAIGKILLINFKIKKELVNLSAAN